jgi:hypothetical protein
LRFANGQNEEEIATFKKYYRRCILSKVAKRHFVNEENTTGKEAVLEHAIDLLGGNTANLDFSTKLVGFPEL